MATTKITQSGINFNYDNSRAVGAALSGVFTHINNEEASKYYYDSNATKPIMALDIDWNGADFDGAPGDDTPGTINTTGDLIKAIKWASTAGGRISDLSSGGIQIGKLTIQDNPSSDNNRIILGGYGSNKTVAYLDDIKTYKAGTGLSLNSTSLTFNHKNSITAGNTLVTGKTLTFGGTFDIPYVSYDAQGHINGTGVSTMTMPNSPVIEDNNQYTVGSLSIPKIGNSGGRTHLALGISSGTKTIANLDDIKTYTAGVGLSLNGTEFNHQDYVEEQTTAVLKKIKYNAQGHIVGTEEVTSQDIMDIIQSTLDSLYEPKNTPSPEITLNPSSNTTITEATTVTATLANAEGNVTWSMTNEGTSGNKFSKSVNGNSITITPLNTQAPKGILNYSKMTDEQNGKVDVQAIFNKVSNLSYSTTVTARYSGAADKSVKLTYSKSALNAGNYTFKYNGQSSFPEGITVVNHGTYVTLTNTTSSPITVLVTIDNSNATAPINVEVTVPVKQSSKYWYVGHITNAQFEDAEALKTVVENNGQITTSTDGPSTVTMPTTTGDVLVYVYPAEWGTPSITDSTGYGTGDMGYEDVELTPPAGYKVRFWDPDNVEGKTLDISWTK